MFANKKIFFLLLVLLCVSIIFNFIQFLKGRVCGELLDKTIPFVEKSNKKWTEEIFSENVSILESYKNNPFKLKKLNWIKNNIKLNFNKSESEKSLAFQLTLSDSINDILSEIAICSLIADKQYVSQYFLQEYNYYEGDSVKIILSLHTNSIYSGQFWSITGASLPYKKLNDSQIQVNYVVKDFLKPTEFKKEYVKLAKIYVNNNFTNQVDTAYSIIHFNIIKH